MNEKVKIALIAVTSFAIGAYAGWQGRGEAMMDEIEQMEKDDVFDQFCQICSEKLNGRDE